MFLIVSGLDGPLPGECLSIIIDIYGISIHRRPPPPKLPALALTFIERSHHPPDRRRGEKGSPGANAMQICCLLCRKAAGKRIYVRRSLSQNSFQAGAFAPQSNVN